MMVWVDVSEQQWRTIHIVDHYVDFAVIKDVAERSDPTPKVLCSHMLEICPSLSTEKASLEVHPLCIGGKEDPVRLTFTASPGAAVVSTIVHLGGRFRMIANDVAIVAPAHPFPKLPVARTVWIPQPDLRTAATSWIYAGGAHHTALSQALQMQHLEDLAEIMGIEFVRIDRHTQLSRLRQELVWNDVSYKSS